MANTTKHMTIRLPNHLAERLIARAEAEGRSVSGMMARLVQQAMEAHGSEAALVVAAELELMCRAESESKGASLEPKERFDGNIENFRDLLDRVTLGIKMDQDARAAASPKEKLTLDRSKWSKEDLDTLTNLGAERTIEYEE